jgi:hypothetical protein
MLYSRAAWRERFLKRALCTKSCAGAREQSSNEQIAANARIASA